jgi:hypothetical protein
MNSLNSKKVQDSGGWIKKDYRKNGTNSNNNWGKKDNQKQTDKLVVQQSVASVVVCSFNIRNYALELTSGEFKWINNCII